MPPKNCKNRIVSAYFKGKRVIEFADIKNIIYSFRSGICYIFDSSYIFINQPHPIISKFAIQADIFMEFVEHRAISTFHTPPKLWVRYVDDTFCVIQQRYAKEFHKHLNSILPSITFTLERVQNQSLAFLDVKVTRNRDKLYLQPSTKSLLTLTDISNTTQQQQQHEIYFCLEKPIEIYNLNGIHK